MNKVLACIVLLALIGGPFTPASRAAALGGGENLADMEMGASPVSSPQSGEVPGWPIPPKPVPHHEPGHLSKTSSYTTEVGYLNAEGLEETARLSGLDAMAADGLDPFSGNYTMVSYDQVLRSWYSASAIPPGSRLETLAISDTIAAIPGSTTYLGALNHDIAAGDVNNDGQLEQIVGWLGGNHLYLSVGETPGLPGKSSSAPAALARTRAPLDGYSLEFDGADDTVNTGDGIDLANASFTVAFWSRRHSYDRNDFVIGQGMNADNQGLQIGFRNNNLFTCAFYANDLDTPLGYTDTGWHHWACTYDADTNLRTIYRDGVQVAQDIATEDYQGAGDLQIGRFSDYSFDGLIDEVGVWDAARSADQVRADALPSAPEESSLIAYWGFDEGTGTTTADASGNGNDGTLLNGTLWNAENAPYGEAEELHLLVRGYDEALWHCQFDVDTGSCMDWDNAAGGILLSPPAAASLGEGEFDVFAVLTDNQVYRRHWQSGWIGGWELYGDWPADAPSWSGPTPELPPLAAVARDGGIDLFRLGPDHTLYWNGGSGWQSLGGMLASGPGAVSLSADSMQVFALGMDDALWTLTYDDGWEEWRRLPSQGMPGGVTIASAPAAVSPAAGQIAVYARGSDNQSWSIEYDGSDWGEWSAAGGELASAPGAVVWSGTTYLFAQKFDDLLQTSLDGLSWTDLGGLNPSCPWFFGVYVCFPRLETVLVAQAVTKGGYQDYSVNVESGYFFGDGRSQIALGYFSAANQVSMAVFESGQRFQPELVSQLVLPQTIDYFSMATGDFLDGDGIDEIALVYVVSNTYNLVVIKVAREGMSVEVTGTVETVRIPDEDGDDYQHGYFSGTLGIAGGDLDRDGQDEIGLVTVWHNPDWMWMDYCDSWLYSIRLRIYDLLIDPGTEEHSLHPYYIGTDRWGGPGAWWGEAIYDDPDPDRPGEYVGISITAGDVDGDGKDEIVNTWPVKFDTYADSCDFQDLPVTLRFVRNLNVIKLPDNPNRFANDWDGEDDDSFINNPEIETVDQRGWTPSYQDRLAVGDLNRDLQGEIVWQMSDQLRTYYYDAGEYQPFSANLPLLASTYPKIAAGAFTGESVRVGPPSYRVQNRVDTMVAMINMPPVHRDLVKDGDGETVLVETPQETCVPSPDSPECTHAKYGTLDFTESEEKIETKHAYTVSAGMESKTCASGGIGSVASLEACVTASIDYTHGGTFDSETDNISSISYRQKVIAADDDKIVYFGTPYAVWEYPLLTDEPGETPGYITVVSPLISQTSDPSSLGGYYNPACDEEWYSGGHVPDNVWSYDPIGAITFEDYNSAGLVYDPGSLDDWFEEEITYETFEQTTDSRSFSHSISAGLERETSAKADLKLFSAESNFKAYIKGSYEYSDMETDRFTTKEGTTFSFWLSPKPLDAKYTTRPILYWANAGHLVLDYQAEPGQGAKWLLYNKPDPAFMLPWYGFPNPDAPENPPCGTEKKLFSHDVIVEPATASTGDAVTITAVVRNFSNVTSNNVRVRFCLNDPGAACTPPNGSAYLGESIIPTLRRPYGPETVSIQWAASGVGRQKIYAVIDPNNQFDEMHDEDDLINNNVAYGLLDMGTASFFDMGQVAEKLYESQTYSQTQTLKMSVYIPLDNLRAVTRFDLKGVDEKVAGIGNPFELVAYRGEIDWATPEDKDFYLTQPDSDEPPAVITISYANTDLAGRNEGSLKLYRLNGAAWEDASRTCGVGEDGLPIYETQRFPDDNLIAVPVCQTGMFMLSDRQVYSMFDLFLPMMSRH